MRQVQHSADMRKIKSSHKIRIGSPEKTDRYKNLGI